MTDFDLWESENAKRDDVESLTVHGNVSTRMLSVRIPLNLHAALRVHCARAGETMQDFVTRALRVELDIEYGGEDVEIQKE